MAVGAMTIQITRDSSQKGQIKAGGTEKALRDQHLLYFAAGTWAREDL